MLKFVKERKKWISLVSFGPDVSMHTQKDLKIRNVKFLENVIVILQWILSLAMKFSSCAVMLCKHHVWQILSGQ